MDVCISEFVSGCMCALLYMCVHRLFSTYLFTHLSIIYIYLFIYPSICPYLFICPSIHPSIHPSNLSGYQYVWVNYNDLTATSLGMMVSKGDSP